MAVWKGGRGVKAPYKTTHVRIPVDIKEKVEFLSQHYKDGDSTKEPISPVKASEIARHILKNKKSAKVSMEALLLAIYGEKISL